MSPFRGWPVLPICLAALLPLVGCSEGDDEGGLTQTPAGGPGKGGPGSPGIKQIMIKLAKGPQSLTPVIGNELNADPIPWDTLQGQTKEYAQSASEMGKYDPPKGAKESWIKLTTAFAESAAELDSAALAKNKATAMVAHDQLKNSCNACHKEHRRMGRGGGAGPGGPGGPPPDLPK